MLWPTCAVFALADVVPLGGNLAWVLIGVIGAASGGALALGLVVSLAWRG